MDVGLHGTPACLLLLGGCDWDALLHILLVASHHRQTSAADPPPAVPLAAQERAVDARCMLLHSLYSLLEGAGVPLPAEDRAAHAGLDEALSGLRALAEQVEAGKEDAFARYAAELATGGWRACNGAWQLRAGLPSGTGRGRSTRRTLSL